MQGGPASGPLDPATRPAENEPPMLSRRTVLRAAGVGAVILGTGAAGANAWSARTTSANTPLYSETVAFTSRTERIVVPLGQAALVVPGTRVHVAAKDRQGLVDAEAAWLDAGADWTKVADRWSSLLRDALLDIRALTLTSGINVAAWTPHWRYIWPRDSTHVAHALLAAGHRAQAAVTLSWLQGVQDEDGWFEARYEPGSEQVPDDRRRQLDGTGWALWALGWYSQVDATDGVAVGRSDELAPGVAELRPMLERGVSRIEACLDRRTGLPPASPDYWEVPERHLTLGTAAPLLAGLRGAELASTALGDRALLARATRTRMTLQGAIAERFGPHQYSRHVTGGHRCASVSFLMRPYLDEVDGLVLAAFDRAEAEMRRPAGGLAPGGGWRRDGISWTPETSLFAVAAISNGRHDLGVELLDWIGRHRTAAGSLPEKVLDNGRPAAVAPLAWTAANVVTAVHALRTA